MSGTLPALAGVFAGLSLMGVGGANAVLPEMQRQVVAHGWMDAEQFAALFALAQAAPGPNMLVVTLVGWRVGGIAGALVATAAFILPAGLLTYAAAGLWQRFRDAGWRSRVQAGLTAVTVGLVLAAAVVLCRTTAQNVPTVLVTAASAGALLFLRLHPLWLLAAGAALGAAGLLA
ncbi:MAG: chromate transporter [Alphaproteobacteria bacterium]|nr:chromate transporter [Alphaproteobacteria bacterium]